MNPDGTGITRIAFARGGVIYVMNTDGGELKQLTATPDQFGGAAPAAALSQNPAFSEIYLMDVHGGHIRPLTDDAAGGPSFSPDGTKILFTRTTTSESGAEIWVINSDGSNPHRLIDPKQTAQHPSWGGGTDS